VTVGWFTRSLCLVKVAQKDGLLRFPLPLLNQFFDQSITSPSIIPCCAICAIWGCLEATLLSSFVRSTYMYVASEQQSSPDELRRR
jgi:hypothetical protein